MNPVNYNDVLQFTYPGVKTDWHIADNGQIVFDTWSGVQEPAPTWTEFQDDITDYENSVQYKDLVFSVDIMTGRFGETFTGAPAITLSPYLSPVQAYAKARNWAGLKAFLAGMVQMSLATQQQSDQITAIILEQGINLADF